MAETPVKVEKAVKMTETESPVKMAETPLNVEKLMEEAYAHLQQPRPLGFGLFGGKKTELQPTEHYRNTTLGITLKQTIEEMIEAKLLTPEQGAKLKTKAMVHFDVHAFGRLARSNTRMQICVGDITMHKEVGKSYTCLLEDSEIRISGEGVKDAKVFFGVDKIRLEMFPAAAVKKRHGQGHTVVTNKLKISAKPNISVLIP